MKKLLAVILLGTLVACNTNLKDDHANNETKTNIKTQVEEQLKVPLSNIENIHYETSLKTNHEEKKLYIEKITEKKHIENYTFENFIFYLVNEEDNEVFIQPDISISEKYLPNVENLSFETINLKGASILIAIHPLNNKENKIFAFGLANDKLTNITFDDNSSIKSLQSVTVDYKILMDEYLQTLTRDGEGYIFTTWKMNPHELKFVNYYQDSFIADEESIQIGKHFAERWLNYDDFFSEFPYYTFTIEDQEKLIKGSLVDLPHPLGEAIDHVLKDYTIYDEDYFDGGPYYETRDGMFFYDEYTRLHTVVIISGKRIKNSYEIEDILGRPTSSGRNDMYPDEKYAMYKFNNYNLWLIYNEQNELTRLEFFSKN